MTDEVEGALRVWHVAQMPCPPFHVPVTSPDDAVRIIDLLAEYDSFQLKNNIKPDYSSASGLEVFESGEWHEWYNEEGEDIDEFAERMQDE